MNSHSAHLSERNPASLEVQKADRATSAPEIRQLIDKLDGSLDCIGVAIRELQERLSPVLSDDALAGVGLGLQKDSPPQPESPIGMQLTGLQAVAVDHLHSLERLLKALRV
jgi:hypothetical protein